MKAEEFFPKVEITELGLVFNAEAVETMELDTPDAKVVLLENSFPDKPKSPKEVLIVKTNNSLCDDLNNVKDVFPANHIRTVVVTTKDGEIVSGSVAIEAETIQALKEDMGEATKFKLLPCNTESPLAKEFREQFNIPGTYYKLAYVNDKRNSIGKDKNTKSLDEERISI
jgi:hypothetical protein